MSTLLEDINQELSDIRKVDINTIRGLRECSPETICIYGGDKELQNEKDILSLYKDYKYLNFDGYLKTLMYTSVMRRPPNIISFIKNIRGKKCLDFGSGVGTHAIELAKNGNDVSILDVEGSLFDFAKVRLKRQGVKFKSYNHDALLPNSEFDVILCLDVLEHVYDPVKELERIYSALKPGGVLCLVVSEMVKKTSGHFQQSIDRWKTYGIPFLNEKFDRLEKGIYQKKRLPVSLLRVKSDPSKAETKETIVTTKGPRNMKIGKDCNISERAVIDFPGEGGSIYMGDRVRIRQDTVLKTNSGYINIGNQVSIGYRCIFYGDNGITIGNDVLISPGVSMYAKNQGIRRNEGTGEQKSNRRGVKIGQDVWIGANAVILDGVTVSTGAIIGAGAVVNKYIPDYEIWAGNPIRKVGERQ